MRIAIINAKGGSGRTTLALNLCGHYARTTKVQLVDQDPQGSALVWAQIRKTPPFALHRTEQKGFDITVIDTAPGLGKTPNADVYVLPTQLDGVSFLVFLKTWATLQATGKPVVVVANRVQTRRKEHQLRLKSKHLTDAHVIRERASLASTYAQGKTVFDVQAPHITKAHADIERLADIIHATLKGEPHA